MYGAFLGDIIGSPFEFDRGDKTKNFDLFTKGCEFTDDTVMTIAVAEGLLNAGCDAAAEEIEACVTASMQKWGHKYPNAGYGSRFYGWLRAKKPHPYNSCGNGSAMRVSAAGWLYDSMERTREAARATAMVTHNHPEGVKAAEATAAAIFLARQGAAKEEIKDYIVKEFHYDLSRTCDEIRPGYYHIEIAQKTVPEAITAFLEADDFEDAIRNAVSLGGDTDTLAAITGSIAEAFFGIPVLLIAECNKFLPEEMLEVVERFSRATGHSSDESYDAKEDYEKNREIVVANHLFHLADTDERRGQSLLYLLSLILGRIEEEGCCPTPFIDKNHVFEEIGLENLILNREFAPGEMRLVVDTMQDSEGRIYIPLFTDDEELSKGATGNIIMNFPIAELVKEGFFREDVEGIVINPFGESLTLPKDILQLVIDRMEKTE